MGLALRLLLDTHSLIWWSLDSLRLSRPGYAAIAEAVDQIFVSAVSAFEIATKYTIGKLPEGAALAERFDDYAREQGFDLLPVTTVDAVRAGCLPLHHKDPFDRLLIAQALNMGLTLVSNETVFETYGAARLW